MLDLVEAHVTAIEAIAGRLHGDPWAAACRAGDFLLEVAARFQLSRRGQREVGRALAVRNRELRASIAYLEELAHIVGHDLQQPLNAAATYAYILTRHIAEKEDERGAMLISNLSNALTRTSTMLDAILEYSRAGSRGESTVSVDTAQLVKRLLRGMEPQIRAVDATVTVGELPTIMAPPTQLTQVIQNLVGNALKFVSANPMIEVTAERGNGEWTFTVRDNGIGIDPSDPGQVFQIFSRASDRYPGSGVGLAISKRVIERQGGRIWFESALGAGAAFKFTVPIPAEVT